MTKSSEIFCPNNGQESFCGEQALDFLVASEQILIDIDLEKTQATGEFTNRLIVSNFGAAALATLTIDEVGLEGMVDFAHFTCRTCTMGITMTDDCGKVEITSRKEG